VRLQGRGEEAVALVRAGPSGPTDAEYRLFERLGAELVVEAGASEAIAARHAGLRCASLVVVLHQALGGELPDPGRLASHAESALPALAGTLEDLISLPPPQEVGHV
jgi:purine nucleoside phosphorylase